MNLETCPEHFPEVSRRMAWNLLGNFQEPKSTGAQAPRSLGPRALLDPRSLGGSQGAKEPRAQEPKLLPVKKHL